jgi:hypothetical protein
MSASLASYAYSFYNSYQKGYRRSTDRITYWYSEYGQFFAWRAQGKIIAISFLHHQTRWVMLRQPPDYPKRKFIKRANEILCKFKFGAIGREGRKYYFYRSPTIDEEGEIIRSFTPEPWTGIKLFAAPIIRRNHILKVSIEQRLNQLHHGDIES